MTFPSYRDLIYLTWKQYLVRFDVILWANLAIALPVHLLATIVTPAQLGIAEPVDFTTWFNSIITDHNFWFVLLLNVLGNFIFILIELMVIVMLRATYHQRVTSWRYLWQQAVQYYPRAFCISAMTIVLTLIGFGLFVIPGIIVGALLSLGLPVVVWENVSPWQALRRSVQLVWPRWWKIFFVLLLTELWLSVFVWLLLSVLPMTWPFTVFGLTVASIISSFQIILRVILYTACVPQKPTQTTPTAP